MFGEHVHRQIYAILLALLGVSMVCSTFLTNLAWVLIGINWLAEGRWRDKWERAKQSRLLHTVVVFYMLLLVGMLWTSDVSNGWSIIQVKLPLLILPLVILTTPPLADQSRRMVAMVYATAVVVVSVITIIRLYTIPDIPYRQAVPHISHIRFAINCCFAIYLAMGQIHRAESSLISRISLGLVVLWLLIVLVCLSSFTAFGILAVVSIAIPIYKRHWVYTTVWLAAVGVVVALVGIEVKNYYRMQPLATQELQLVTANGRPYTHKQDGLIENGNYINNYICEEELREQWNRRSKMPFDSLDVHGYYIESTLIRYLNACGLTKDSAGVVALTDAQIRSVEQGVVNPVYQQHHVIRRMVYVSLLGRECYYHTKETAGYSISQRFALWESSVEVIKQHPIVGVGTGDVVQAIQDELYRQGCDLAGTPMRSHNQYLGTAAAIGIPATVIVLVLLLCAIVKDWKRYKNCSYLSRSLFLAWVLTIMISMFTEDTLDTLAGILVAIFPMVILPPPPHKNTNQSTYC